MKKLLILLLLALSLTTFAQEKQVAILEPIAMTKEVSTMHRSMVRGEMVKAIGRQSGYAAFTRTDIDQIMAEQNFQQSGMVTDSTRKRIGAMQGVDYVCVTKITKEGNNYYLEANLVNIETGKISNPATQYGELTGGSLSNMLAACEKLAAELVGKKVYPSSSYTKSQSTASSTTSYSETTKPKPTPQSFSTAQISSFDPNIKVEIISCTRNEYDVLLEYKITYTGLGDISSFQILLGDSHNAFFDNLGNSYKGYVSLGQKGSSHVTLFAPLMENIPTKGSVKYSRVPRDANSLTVKLLVQSAQTGRGYITLKNVRIY